MGGFVIVVVRINTVLLSSQTVWEIVTKSHGLEFESDTVRVSRGRVDRKTSSWDRAFLRKIPSHQVLGICYRCVSIIEFSGFFSLSESKIEQGEIECQDVGRRNA